MQKRSFLLLVGATILLVAAAAYALATGDRAITAAPDAQRVFPQLAAHLGDLAWMRISHGATKADFNLIGGRWTVVEKGNYPAAPGKVRRLLLGLAELTLVEPKTTRPELFGRLDLDDPSNGKSTLVALQDRTGKAVAELIVGKMRHDRLGGGNDAVYLRKPREDQTWLARGSLDLPPAMVDWLDRRIIDLPAARIDSVSLTAFDGAVLALRRDPADGKFVVADPPEGAKFKDAAVAAPAAALAGLDLDDVKPAAALHPPSTGSAMAAFIASDGLAVTLRLFTSGEADWVTLSATGSGAAEKAAAALNAKLSHWAYRIPAERAKLLRTKLGDLVEPQKGS
ncbi:MAG: DUF4340 domain-containing protein [Stellaceae bacterium]